MKLCEYFFDEDSYKKLNQFVNVIGDWAKQNEKNDGKFVEELLYDYVLHIFRHTGYLTKNSNGESLYHKLGDPNGIYLKTNIDLINVIKKINGKAFKIKDDLTSLVNKVNGIFGKTSE